MPDPTPAVSAGEHQSALAGLLADAFEAFRPPPIERLSDWAGREFYLTKGPAEGTTFKPWAYQIEMLDAMGDENIERVSVLKAARVGYTQCMVATLANYAKNNPCSVILLVPTQDDARKMMVKEVEPAFEGSPHLDGLIRTGRAGMDGRNTMFSKMFPGGSIDALAARAPRNLRMLDAKVVLADEVDGMEPTVEGDPIDLIEKRTQAHADRKLINGSTPTLKDISRIAALYELSDKRVFEVPCVECDEFSEIVWENIIWDGRGEDGVPDDPDTAEWMCPKCGCPVSEIHKPAMTRAGRWRATAPEIRNHAGFKLSALISQHPNAAWRVLAQEYITAREAGPIKMQVFVNTVLGLPYDAAQGAGTDADALMERRESYAADVVPSRAACITAGVDVQHDRLEVRIDAWGLNDECWCLDYRILSGDTLGDVVWEKLTELADEWYTHELGGELQIESMFIDSGDRTQRVYEYCFAQGSAGRPIFACKGVPGQGKPVAKKSDKTFKSLSGLKGQLIQVGADTAKTVLYERLALPLGRAGSVHFPQRETITKAWFKQLTSHKVMTKYAGTMFKRVWHKPEHVRDEALDCTIYSYAARCLLNIDIEQRLRDLRDPPEKISAADLAKEYMSR